MSEKNFCFNYNVPVQVLLEIQQMLKNQWSLKGLRSNENPFDGRLYILLHFFLFYFWHPIKYSFFPLKNNDPHHKLFKKYTKFQHFHLSLSSFYLSYPNFYLTNNLIFNILSSSFKFYTSFFTFHVPYLIFQLLP